MEVRQVAATVSNALKQAFGEETITATDLTGLVSEGNSIINSADDGSLDALRKALVDQIRLLIFANRRYSRTPLNIIHTSADYGSIVEKVYYEPIEPQDNASWLLANGKSVDPFIVSMSPIEVKLFNDVITWEVPFTIYKRQLKSAFTGETQLSQFISGLYNIAQNSMEVQLEKVEHWTMNNFIGNKLYYASQPDAKGVQVINLLKEYNTMHSSSLTMDTCIHDFEFLKYAYARIMIIWDSIDNMSSLFNIEQYKRFTPPDKRRMTVLSQFESFLMANMTNENYHNDMYRLPEHRSIPYWQGTGTDLSFADCSSINLITSSAHTIAQSGIVAVIHDFDAMGITIYDERVTNQYNGRGEYDNYWIKADVNLFNDLSENAVVFTISDETSQVVNLSLDDTSVRRKTIKSNKI